MMNETIIHTDEGYKSDDSDFVTIRVVDKKQGFESMIDVYPDNTVKQVVEAIRDEMSVDLRQYSFCKAGTNKLYDDFDMTFEKLGMKNYDKLMFVNANDKKTQIKITVVDYDGSKGPKTLSISIKATLEDIAKEAGFKENYRYRYIFRNKNHCYSDKELTLEDVGAEYGDVIEINRW